MYNVVDGIDVYDVKANGQKRKPKKHLSLPKKPRTKHAVHVAYINEGRGIVCGTTTGDVCVWNMTSGEVYQALALDKDDIAQAVAVCLDFPEPQFTRSQNGTGMHSWLS